jgi:DNA-binding SARP family transcriptional activator
VFDIAESCKPVVGYLIINRHRALSRSQVAEALWQERETPRARRCLSTALWRLKQSAPDVNLVHQTANGDRISFNWSLPGWVDVVAFESRAVAALAVPAQAAGHREICQMRRAVNLYRGDLLSGIDEEWVLIERQRLGNIYLDLLHHLASSYDARSDMQNALIFARRLSALDPLREDIHRLIMRLFVSVGNGAKAIEQYRICQGELSSELGVEPTEETQALFRIIAGRSMSAPVSLLARQQVSLGLAGDHVRWVRKALAASDKRLVESLKLLQRAERVGEPPSAPE